MPRAEAYKVAIVSRGDADARQAATPDNNRFHRVFEELAAHGITAEPPDGPVGSAERAPRVDHPHGNGLSQEAPRHALLLHA